MNVKSILSRLKGVRRNRRGWTARCPAHQDRKPSLSIHEAEGRVLLHCHAGCAPEAVCAAIRIKMRDLFSDGKSEYRTNRRSNARTGRTYDYLDGAGNLLFQVLRYEPKNFKQRRPDGNGGWLWNLDGVPRVLYRLPEILKATNILIVEGEKDADTAHRLGHLATCNAGGAGKWRPEYTDSLRGKYVTIIADADDPGRRHAEQIARSLYDQVESLKMFEMPGAKDLSEWLEQGGTQPALDDLIHNAPEWKPQLLEGHTALDAVLVYLRRFVCVSESQARVVALWAVHTHVFSAGDATPYLAITSAEKQSGKTRLLEVLETIVASPWLTGSVTAAVLTRKIDLEKPTLLLDESDAAFGGSKEYAEALRGVLNTGHRRSGTTSRCVGKGADISFRDFSTFCPKAIAGIGKLPDTVADRAIPIRLKRAARNERVERFRLRNVQTEAARLRGQMGGWGAAIVESLREAYPDLPSELTDRQQDGAEPLLAIADLAGSHWAEKARAALVELWSGESAEDSSIGVQLLFDIREIFEEHRADSLPSATIVEHLVGLEGRPWPEHMNGKPISVSRLARILKRFEITPRKIRFSSSPLQGYARSVFEDAWSRYLPAANRPPRPEQAEQHSIDKDLAQSLEPEQDPSVPTPENAGSPAFMRSVPAVPVLTSSAGEPEQMAEPKVHMSPPAPQACRIHSSLVPFWRRSDGAWFCARCHPEPDGGIKVQCGPFAGAAVPLPVPRPSRGGGNGMRKEAVYETVMHCNSLKVKI